MPKTKRGYPLELGLKVAIANYFKKCSIKCDATNIVIRPNIFELLGEIYNAIDFPDKKNILFLLPISNYLIQQCYDYDLEVNFLNSDIKNFWKIDIKELDLALEKNQPRILFLNYPNSTSGVVINKEDAVALAKIIKKYPNLIVIIDESLRELAIDGNNNPFSLAAIYDISHQIITISSLKYYGIGNLNIFFACIRDKRLIAKLFAEKIFISTANQHIAIASLTESEQGHKNFSDIINWSQENFALVVDELNEINKKLGEKLGKENDYVKPVLDDMRNGNHSMLLQFAGLKGSKPEIKDQDNKVLQTDLDIAEFLKKETGIMMMPGQFYLLPEEEMILKIYLLKSKQELRLGFKKIGLALIKLRILGKTVSKAKYSRLAGQQKNREI